MIEYSDYRPPVATALAVGGAHRNLAKPRPRADLDRLAAVQLLPNEKVRLTKDTEAFIPQIMDVFDGTIRDTDELLRMDADAYEEIFDDDAIATAIDNTYLRVAQAQWQLDANDNPDTAKLIPALKRYALERPGWQRLIHEMAYAEIIGIVIIRMVWENIGHPGKDKLRAPLFVVKSRDGFVYKDKRRFRPGDINWENMYLVDNGIMPIGSLGHLYATNVQKPIDRDNFIIHRWRNTENNLGWGTSKVAARLLRLKRYRRPLIHLLMQALENTGGGIRYAELSAEFFQGKSAAEQSSAMISSRNAMRDAISGDSIVFPAGVKPTLFFPPDTVGGAILETVDGWLGGQIQKQLNGIKIGEGDHSEGTFAFGKELMKTPYRHDMYRAQAIGETLTHDYLTEWLALNPWVYRQAGVSTDTPVPSLRAVLEGGDDLTAAANIINQSKVAIRHTDYAERLGLPLASDEEVERGEAFIPAMIAPAGYGTGGALPGSPGVSGSPDSAGTSLLAGAGAGPRGGAAAGTPIETDEDGNPVGADGEALVAQGVEVPKMQDMRLAYAGAIEQGDRALADLLRRKMWSILGETQAPAPLTDAEWAEMRGAQAAGAQAAGPREGEGGDTGADGDKPFVEPSGDGAARPDPFDDDRGVASWFDFAHQLKARGARTSGRAGDFDESKHPRDGGKFSTKEGAGAGAGPDDDGKSDNNDKAPPKGEGSTPEEWDKAGWDAGEMKAWQASGVQDAGEAVKWGDAFSDDPADTQDWRDADFDADAAIEWVAAFDDPAQAATWRDAGFDPDSAYSWRDWGASVDDAQEWRSMGVKSADDANEWTEYLDTPAQAKAWIEAGFDADDAGAWMGEWEPGPAKTLKAAGLDPEQAESLKYSLEGVENKTAAIEALAKVFGGDRGRARRVLAALRKGNFDESKHPRGGGKDNPGQFASSDGGGKGDGDEPKQEFKAKGTPSGKKAAAKAKAKADKLEAKLAKIDPKNAAKVRELLDSIPEGPRGDLLDDWDAKSLSIAEQAKGLFAKTQAGLIADGINPRAAKAAATLAAATAVPGASVANITGQVLTAIGMPGIGLALVALPTGLIEPTGIPLAVKGVAKIVKGVKALMPAKSGRARRAARKKARNEVATPEKTEERARAIVEATSEFADDETRLAVFELAMGATLNEGATFEEALEVATKYVGDLSDDQVAALTKESDES